MPANRDRNHPPVVKLILNETNCVWLLSEIDPDYPNIAYGLCDWGDNFPKLEFVDLNELRELRSPISGYNLQRAAFFEGKYPLSVYATAARICDRITEKEALLKKCYAQELLSKKNRPQP